MNRIIKFRAWDGKNMHHTTDDYLKWFPMRSFNKDEKVNDFVWMQFTGLHDKNGKEIYEGDVVRRATSANGGHEYRTVEWHASTRRVGWNVSLVDTWEVIGNIYENPELLNKQA